MQIGDIFFSILIVVYYALLIYNSRSSCSEHVSTKVRAEPNCHQQTLDFLLLFKRKRLYVIIVLYICCGLRGFIPHTMDAVVIETSNNVTQQYPFTICNFYFDVFLRHYFPQVLPSILEELAGSSPFFMYTYLRSCLLSSPLGLFLTNPS